MDNIGEEDPISLREEIEEDPHVPSIVEKSITVMVPSPVASEGMIEVLEVSSQDELISYGAGSEVTAVNP